VEWGHGEGMVSVVRVMMLVGMGIVSLVYVSRRWRVDTVEIPACTRWGEGMPGKEVELWWLM